MAIGKVEQGVIQPGMKVHISPLGKQCTVVNVFIEEQEVSHATVGECITCKVQGQVAEEDLKRGYVMGPIKNPCLAVRKFKAQLRIQELTEERPVLTAGYRCVIHFHCATEE